MIPFLRRRINGRKPTIKPESWYARPDLMEQVLMLAIRVIGNRSKAFKWMEEPNSYLDGETPIDLVETEAGAAKVIAYIERYEQHQAAS